MTDDELEARFEDLARAEAARTPPFARVLAGRARARRPSALAALGLGLALLAALWLVIRSPIAPDEPELARSVRSASSAGDPILSETPEFSAALRLAEDLSRDPPRLR